MKAIFFSLFSWILDKGFKKVLIALGVTVVSSAVISTVLNTYINKAITAAASTNHTYLGLLSISGVDKAISIIIGALIARATIVSMSASFIKR